MSSEQLETRNRRPCTLTGCMIWWNIVLSIRTPAVQKNKTFGTCPESNLKLETDGLAPSLALAAGSGGTSCFPPAPLQCKKQNFRHMSSEQLETRNRRPCTLTGCMIWWNIVLSIRTPAVQKNKTFGTCPESNLKLETDGLAPSLAAGSGGTSCFPSAHLQCTKTLKIL